MLAGTCRTSGGAAIKVTGRPGINEWRARSSSAARPLPSTPPARRIPPVGSRPERAAAMTSTMAISRSGTATSALAPAATMRPSAERSRAAVQTPSGRTIVPGTAGAHNVPKEQTAQRGGTSAHDGAGKPSISAAITGIRSDHVKDCAHRRREGEVSLMDGQSPAKCRQRYIVGGIDNLLILERQNGSKAERQQGRNSGSEGWKVGREG